MAWTWDDIDAGWRQLTGTADPLPTAWDEWDEAAFIRERHAHSYNVPQVLLDFADMILNDAGPEDSEKFDPAVWNEFVPDAVYDV